MTMVDADGASSDPVPYALVAVGTGWRLSADVDIPWLREPSRNWPIKVDPTVYFGSNYDTWIEKGPNNVPVTTPIGFRNHVEVSTNGNTIRRALMRFNFSGIPTGASITQANVNLHTIYTGSPSDPVGVHRLKRAFDPNTATWNSSASGTAWAAPGGDFVATPSDSHAVDANCDCWVRWNFTSIAQAWAGGSANYGIMLKKPNEVYGPYGEIATDFYGNHGGTNYPWLEVAWTAPATLSFSDEAWDRRTAGYAHSAPLIVNAASNGVPLQSIDVAIDGEAQPQTVLQSCPTAPCTLSIDTAVDVFYLAEGAHALSVTATDTEGTRTTGGWNFTVLPSDGTDDTSYWDDASAPDYYGDAPDTSLAAQAAAPGDPPHPNLRPGGPGWGLANSPWQDFADADLQKINVNMRDIIPWDIMLRDPAMIAKYNLSNPSGYCCKADLSTGNSDPATEPAVSPTGEGQTLSNFRAWYGQCYPATQTAPAYCDNARAKRAQLVTFGHTVTSGGTMEGYLPTESQYALAVKTFRKEFPDVKTLGSWNEPNTSDQPTSRRYWPTGTTTIFCDPQADRCSGGFGAFSAGRFWHLLAKECATRRLPDGSTGTGGSTCTPLAGEFSDNEEFALKLDSRRMRIFSKEYFREYKDGMNATSSPNFADATVWGWHVYGGALRYTRSGTIKGSGDPDAPIGRTTSRLVALGTSIQSTDNIWVTEGGGRRQVYSSNGRIRQAAIRDQGSVNATIKDDDNYTLNALARAVPGKETRFYRYQWFPDAKYTIGTWDSALKDVNGNRRDAFAQYVNKVCYLPTPYTLPGPLTSCPEAP